MLRGYEAVARGELELGRELLAPDARWHSAIGGMIGKTLYVGFDEIAQLVTVDIPSVLDGFRPEVLELRDLGGGVVFAAVRWTAILRESRVEVDQLFGQVCTVADGLLQELRSYESVDDGLAAATVLRVLRAFNQRDLDALVEFCDPEVEIVVRRSALEGAFTGHDGAHRWAREALEWAPDYRFLLEDVRVVDGVVHVTGRERGTGRVGIPIDDPLDARVALRDGRIHRVRTRSGS